MYRCGAVDEAIQFESRGLRGSANDKAGGKGADNPKLATNFEIQDYHNETLNGEELEEASDDDEYEWYYYEDTDESNEGETDSTEKPTFKDEEL